MPWPWNGPALCVIEHCTGKRIVGGCEGRRKSRAGGMMVLIGRNSGRQRSNSVVRELAPPLKMVPEAGIEPAWGC